MADSHLERAAILIQRAESILRQVENYDMSSSSSSDADDIESTSDFDEDILFDINASLPETEVQSEEIRYPCPICNNQPFDRALSCGHVICQKCLNRIVHCPFCRQQDFFTIPLYLP